jgi:predicted enzyme related to lactoylglutathione lyase
VELATSELVKSTRFYGRVLDWEHRSMGVQSESGVPIHYDGWWRGPHMLGGLYEHIDGPRALCGGPHWLAYVAVADLQLVLARALALGASVLVPVCDVSCFGRLCVLADPQGAVFGLWKPCAGTRAQQVRDRVGCARWYELAARDPEAAARFYAELLGWTPRVVDFGRGEYHLLERDGALMAGIASPSDPHGRLEGLRGPQWITYFQVADCAAVSARAAALLGRIVTPTTSVPNVGHYSVLADPQRAVLGLFTPA